MVNRKTHNKSQWAKLITQVKLQVTKQIVATELIKKIRQTFLLVIYRVSTYSFYCLFIFAIKRDFCFTIFFFLREKCFFFPNKVKSVLHIFNIDSSARIALWFRQRNQSRSYTVPIKVIQLKTIVENI